MQYQLELTFETSEGEKVNIIIKNVKHDLAEDQISKLMDTIITNDVFITSKGELKSKSVARLRKIDDTTFKF